jgi:hypothetical protein
MKNTFERKLIERGAAASVIALAAYALFSGSGYGQETTPNITADVDGKETKPVQQFTVANDAGPHHEIAFCAR